MAAEPAAAAPRPRLVAIDLLRGCVMLLMLLDHVRETFYLHHQVGDPMDLQAVSPALFLTRLLSHPCAPVFVFLAGLSARLQCVRHADGRCATSRYLLVRGLLLVVLELTVVNAAWTGSFAPGVVYLQVIWAIGLSMIALSALLWLPQGLLLALAVVLVAGHHLLDGMAPESGPWRTAWLVAHERGWFELAGVRLRTSYPVLPWIGVIALGYIFGSAYADPARRQRWSGWASILLLSAFVLLRGLNRYGDAAWHADGGGIATTMAWFNLTKYPPSVQFVLFTLGLGTGALWLFGHRRVAGALAPLAQFGAAPMFFYLLHLWLLRLFYTLARAAWGDNQGAVFGVDGVVQVWTIALALAMALWLPTRAFARFRAAHPDWRWLRYL